MQETDAVLQCVQRLPWHSHTGTAAKTDDRLHPDWYQRFFGFFYIDSSWIGNRFVINGIRKYISFRVFSRRSVSPRLRMPLSVMIRTLAHFFLRRISGRDFHASDYFRVAVWKERKSEFECFLESTTVNFSQCIHKSKILSMI